MAELPLDQAVPRFKENEDRLDTFVNSATGYTTSGGVSVQSIQQFLASIGSNGIDFVDNAKARFGTGNDLEIYHDASNSWIRETGTGNLNIGGDGEVRIMGNSGGEFMARFIANGNVNLYHNNNLKLQTISSGINVTGDINGTDKLSIVSADPEIFLTDTSTSVTHSIDGNSGVGNLFVHVDKDETATDPKFAVNIGSQDSVLVAKSTGIDVTGKGTYTGAGSFEALELKTTDANRVYVTGNSTTSGDMWRLGTSTSNANLNIDALQSNGEILLRTGGTTERMRINSTGVGIGTTSPSVKLQTTVVNSSTEAIRITNDTDAVRTHMYPGEIQAHNSNLTLNANDGGFATVIKAAGTERMRVNSSGINVTGSTITTGTSGTTQWQAGSGANKLTIASYDNNIFYHKLSSGNSTQYQVGVEDNIPIHTITNNTVRTALLGNGNFGVGTTNPSAKIEAYGTDASIIVHNNFNSRGGIGALSGGRVGLVTTSINDDLVFGYSGSPISSGSFVERMRIDNGTGGVTVSTNLNVGNATPAGNGTIESHVQSSSTPALITYSGSSLLRTHISFENANGQVGKINTTGTATSYVTSSDYRLKTDVQEMTGSIDRVKALRPVNFEWINDGTRVDGFLAHEAQEVVPEAISGEKDAMRDQEYVVSEATGDIYTPAVEATYETIQVELTPAVEAVYETVTVEISPAVEATYDEDGNELTPAIEAVTEEQEQLVTPAVDATYEEQQQELTPAIDEVIHSSDVVEPDELEEGQLWRETTEKVMATRQVPDYQGIDQSKIVPLLTSALQDAIAKIEALETRLEALEA
jgi:hypothetical protein